MTLDTMNAAFCTGYGDAEVIEIKNIPIPKPQKTELLIKVYASTVTAADSLMRQGKPKFSRLFLGLRKPKNPIIGTGFSGEVVQVGQEVSRFKVGDLVFGESIFGGGSNAGFVNLPESNLVLHKPEALTFNEAATLSDGFLTSYSFLKDIGQLKKGQRILINGASGSLGTAAIQLAKRMGAYVVGVCSGKNTLIVKQLGADEVVDYTTTNFTKLPQTFDLIYDTVGKSSFLACKKRLTENGKYITPVLSGEVLIQSIYTALFSKKKALFSATGIRPVSELRPLMEELSVFFTQKTLCVLIDKVFTLQDISKAHTYVDKGHKTGNVVISMSLESEV